jgi:FG-GAP-like repeat
MLWIKFALAITKGFHRFMKKHLVLCTVLLLASLPSFAAHAQPSLASQFKPKHSHLYGNGPAKEPTGKAALRLKGGPGIQPARPPMPGSLHARSSKARKNSSAPVSTVGLVSGIQIPMGGEDDDESAAVIGDFNGDGKKDIAKLVVSTDGNSTYSIAVILSNGDGTFQAAQLTATPSNTDDPIIVGDVNGDGKDDILMVHPNGDGGACRAAATSHGHAPGGCTLSSIDVLISNGDGTFTLGTNYAISDFSLNGGLLTDIDGDGKLDLVVLDSEALAAEIVLLGNGDGTFQAASTLATLTGPAPNNINFADFNGDGKLDFEGDSANQPQIYLASGVGFLAPVALVTSDTVYDSCGDAAGDLNGDGIAEIVSVNCSNNTLTIYLNNGDGSFQTGVYVDNVGDTYMYPGDVTIADVNGDGKNDIVLGNSYSGDLSVFLGNGDGTFAVEAVGYDIGGYPWTSPLVADFNGDGLMDIVEPDDYYSLVYLEGYGDGTFRAGLSYYLPNSFAEYAYSYSVASGDFNGDGFGDVVAGQDGNVAAPGVVVYLANADGTMQPGVAYGTSSTLSYVTVADFNGDSKMDIAATDYVNGIVQILLGNGDGTFTIGQSYATDAASSPFPTNMITGDFNHDGHLDLAIVNEGSSTIGVLLGNGDGTFGSLANYSLSAQAYGIAAADLNGDGYLDLAITLFTDSGNSVAVLLGNNDNSGHFQTETDIATGTGQPEYVALGDLNGDGKLDMAVTMTSGPTYSGALVVALGNGDGTFQTPIAYPSSTQAAGLGYSHPANVQMVDFDADGKLDLVYLNTDFGTVGVMFGLGDGTFSNPVEFPTGGYVWGMALADVNNDGAIDVVTGNDYVGGVSVLLNNSGSATQPDYTFAPQTTTATVTAGSSASYDLALAGRNGYNGTITFSCTGLPSKATCSLSPTSVVGLGNLPLSTTLTISTVAATTSLVSPVHQNSAPGLPTILMDLGGLGLFGLVLAGGRKKRSIQMGILLRVVLLSMMVTLVGCGGSSTSTPPPTGTPGTPAGTYTVAVIATGTGNTAPSHTVNVTLIVQ